MGSGARFCLGLGVLACTPGGTPEHRQGILVDTDADGHPEVLVVHVTPSGHDLSLRAEGEAEARWRTSVPGEPHMAHVAVVMDGVLLVTTTGSDRPALLALSADTGELLWARSDPGRVPVPFVLDAFLLVEWQTVSQAESLTERVRPKTGTTVWTTPCSVRRTPAGPRCIGGDDELLAVTPASGEVTRLPPSRAAYLGMEGVLSRTDVGMDRIDPQDGKVQDHASGTDGTVLAVAPTHVLLTERRSGTTRVRGAPWEGQGTPWELELTGKAMRFTPLTVHTEPALPRHIPLMLEEGRTRRGFVLDTHNGHTSPMADDTTTAYRCGNDWLLSTPWWVSRIDGSSGVWGERTSGSLAGPCLGGRALIADRDPTTGEDRLTVVDARDLAPQWTVRGPRPR